MAGNTCTCHQCLCFYIAVCFINQCMIGILVSTYTLFGSMPPSFSMAWGFWLLLYTNYFGQFVSLVGLAVFRRSKDVRWVNKLTDIGITVTAILFLVGSILFFLPLSAEGMMTFSKTYYKLYKSIPPFLDRIQSKVQCCGIDSYLDYGKHFGENPYKKDGFKVYRQANPNDDFFHQLVSTSEHNRTVARQTYGLDVPQSCCPYEKAVDPHQVDCGKKVEYTGATEETFKELFKKQEASALEKINNPKMGCYEKYRKITESGYQFQLTFLIGTIQFISLFQCIMFLTLFWFHKLALRTIRQMSYWLPELTQLHHDMDAARHHARLEAEADSAHEPHELKTKASRTSVASSRISRMSGTSGKSTRSKVVAEKAKLEKEAPIH